MAKKKMEWVIGEDTHREKGLCADCGNMCAVRDPLVIEGEEIWHCLERDELIPETSQMAKCSNYIPKVKIKPTKAEKNIIFGKHNVTHAINTWKLGDGMSCESGDYAIVENINDYDLVKVICSARVDDKYIPFLTGRNTLKRVIKVLPRKEVREDA